jgi:hypothetical protein
MFLQEHCDDGGAGLVAAWIPARRALAVDAMQLPRED